MDDRGAERLIVAMFALAVEDLESGDSTAAAWLQSTQAVHWAELLGLDPTKLLANARRLIRIHEVRHRDIDNAADLRESFEAYVRGDVAYKQLTRHYNRSFESIHNRWVSMGLIGRNAEDYKLACLVHQDWQRSGLKLPKYAKANNIDPNSLAAMFRRNGLTLSFGKAAIDPDELRQQYDSWLKSGMPLDLYSRSLGMSSSTMRQRFAKYGYEIPGGR